MVLDIRGIRKDADADAPGHASQAGHPPTIQSFVYTNSGPGRYEIGGLGQRTLLAGVFEFVEKLLQTEASYSISPFRRDAHLETRSLE